MLFELRKFKRIYYKEYVNITEIILYLAESTESM